MTMTDAAAYLLLTGRHASAAPYPPEAGFLRTEGDRLVTEAGQIWFGRGLTMFLLYARYLRGEDIRPQLAWCRQVGANYIRVFGPVPVPPWNPEWAFYQPLVLDGAKLRAFAGLVGESGLRLEWVPICGPTALEASRRYLEASFEALAGLWNVFVECTNEPGQGATYQGDLHALIDGLNRRGILTATGQAWLFPGQSAYSKAHWLDYGTVHTQRDGHYPHDGKECWEWRLGGEGAPGMPWLPGSGRAEWDDEPRRIDEIPQSIDDHLSHYATSGIFAGASLLHFDHGKFGLVPPAGGWQDRIIREVAQVWAFCPPFCSYGTYARGDWTTFPVVWRPEDSQVRHAYGMWHGEVGWFVNCLPVAGWRPVAKPGFQLVEAGPRPWIFKARRG